MEIITPRLLLRRHALCDYDRYWSMLNDPEAKRYTGGTTRLSYLHRLEIFRRECQRPFSPAWAEFAVVHRESGLYLGYCGFQFSYELSGNEFLYGYCRDSWGHGYGFEAASAALGWFFAQYPHDEYRAAVDVKNAASAHILKKLGFTELYAPFVYLHDGLTLYAVRRGGFTGVIPERRGGQ